MSNENTKTILNQAVADCAKAAALVHQVHWYMRGRGFLKLHPKMDKYIDAINEAQDAIAERLITIGGSPVSTLKEFDELSKVTLEPTSWDEKSMDERLAQVLEVHKYLADLFEKGIRVADQEDDPVTADIFTVAAGDFEKTVWMLEAELA